MIQEFKTEINQVYLLFKSRAAHVIIRICGKNAGFCNFPQGVREVQCGLVILCSVLIACTVHTVHACMNMQAGRKAEAEAKQSQPSSNKYSNSQLICFCWSDQTIQINNKTQMLMRL